MGYCISVFTELLQQLAACSVKVDTGTLTHEEFDGLQSLLPRIVKGRQEGRFNSSEYDALTSAFYNIRDGACIVLGLDPDAQCCYIDVPEYSDTVKKLMEMQNRTFDALPADDEEIARIEQQLREDIHAAGLADKITLEDLVILTVNNYHTVCRAADRVMHEANNKK